MISGEFNQKGSLVFQVDLIAADETDYPVKVILDTGFTGWLIVNMAFLTVLRYIESGPPLFKGG